MIHQLYTLSASDESDKNRCVLAKKKGSANLANRVLGCYMSK